MVVSSRREDTSGGLLATRIRLGHPIRRVDLSAIDTALVLDVLSYLATYLDEHDMRIIKNDVLFNVELHNNIVNRGYTSQYDWMLEYHAHHPQRDNVIQEGKVWNILTSKEYSIHSCLDSTCYYVALHGNAKMMKIARAYNYRWSTRICAHAAHNGNLDILIWARANGCPWDAWTYASAERNNHLAIMQWSKNNGCKINTWDELIEKECRDNNLFFAIK